VHVTTEGILKSYREIMSEREDIGGSVPELWDGKAAKRIVEIISREAGAGNGSE